MSLHSLHLQVAQRQPEADGFGDLRRLRRVELIDRHAIERRRVRDSLLLHPGRASSDPAHA